MAYTVKQVINNTDAQLDVIDAAKKTIEPISPHSMKPLINENLLDLTFVSKTSSPIFIRITSITGDGDDVDGDVGDGDDPVLVEVGDPEEEEDLKI
ncbi:hypothetical protein [Rhodohalobacter sp. 614A]|uniref:hypothetical protein n=1 Tax=Rhodohalobacter sp. 614A TaxID=2908649 RepID=UPI001F20DD59|nr:hypothetical protein [Rhodohalobacter sp. 614A]